jgi:hypothetical protein
MGDEQLYLEWDVQPQAPCEGHWHVLTVIWATDHLEQSNHLGPVIDHYTRFVFSDLVCLSSGTKNNQYM